MSGNLERRHSRWYELLFFNGGFLFLLGLGLVVILPGWLRWGTLIWSWPNVQSVEFNSMLVNGVAFLCVFLIVRRIQRFPGAQTLEYMLPAPLLVWAMGVIALFFLREDYSRSVLLLSFSLAMLWVFVGYFLGRRYRIPKLAVVPYGRAAELVKQRVDGNLNFLDAPSLDGRRFDGLVADLHADDLPADWERFLAQCTLARIPVYNLKQVQESLTGRIRMDHLSENEFGALLPSPGYEVIKRLLDIVIVVVMAPLWVPLMFITGVIIKLETPGPMFFVQERVGQGNKTFRVYKLRSMGQDSEKNGAQFATANDVRVTRVGRVLRKTRIDEIPQFINVLKGDMSLIGPRPEQRVFVEQFEQKIPFYAYRHVVRPGITGWAQVVHGYAGDADDTRVKIEYDFYYIKHFSLWLDILIIFKTVRTILTGFGAR